MRISLPMPINASTRTDTHFVCNSFYDADNTHTRCLIRPMSAGAVRVRAFDQTCLIKHRFPSSTTTLRIVHYDVHGTHAAIASSFPLGA